MMGNTLHLVISFLFGAAIGSFLNVVILRLPEKASIVFPASHCPSCKAPLAWYENVPIVSYVFLRGKCGHCKTSISLQYPVVELCMGLLSTAVIYKFGLTFSAAGYFLFCASLVAIIWIDIRHQIIPDSISLPGIVIGFLFSFIAPHLTWLDSLIGLVAGGGILYSIALLYYLLKKQQGMGGGDIKLLAMIGAFLGWQSLLFVIFTSSLIGTMVAVPIMLTEKKGVKTKIPFGPFLSIAALIYLFFDQQILYYFSLYLQGRLF